MKAIKIILSLILIFIYSTVVGQKNPPRLSPKSFVGQTIGYTNVEITYSSPGVKGRKIWGDLVPYDEVWRTGANEATTIDFDQDVIIEGNNVPLGKYSLFTIPGKDTWTIILNKIYEQWGAFKYDQKEDLVRFKVKPKPNHHVERLKFGFEFIEPYVSNVNIEWAELMVSFKINSDTQK